MNREWSERNKTMQAQIKKRDTYKMGIDTLLSLRSQLIQALVSFKEELCREDFNAIPFKNADGYHSKTIAYSIWHIFRIEDIVAHTVINEDEQVFFAGNYQERIHSPIITTGNELVKQQIADFSKQLNLEELYLYMFEVRESTEKMLERFSYDELKRKIPDERMPTTCMEMSPGIPNRLHARGIKSRDPPATPEDPAALTAATTHMIRALPAETWIPKVWAAARAIVEIVMAAPAIFMAAPRGMEME